MVALGVGAAALLTACGGEEVGAKPTLPSETPALWNPCDALDVAFVKAEFAVDAVKHTGTPTKSECRFTPVSASSGASGGADAIVTANYLLFPGKLADAWQKMGQSADADVRTPAIASADDARIVVNATNKQLYVTGFVQNGTLIQQVDVVDPKPYAEKRIVSAVEATLTRLSERAAQSGAGTPASPSAPSSSASTTD